MDEKNIAIQKMFDSITGTYDFLNHSLSLGQDYWWRKVTVKSLPRPGKNEKILDLCCGSGDLSLELFYEFPQNQILSLDFSGKMLKQFDQKIQEKNLKRISKIGLKGF